MSVVEITGDEAARIKATERHDKLGASVIGRMREGAVLFLDKPPGGMNSLLKREGYKVNQRSAVREGVKGFYVWATKVEETE